MIRSTRAKIPWSLVIDPFHHQLSNHSHEGRVCAGRCRAPHIHPDLFSELLRFDIQIVDDLHMIGNKTNRRDYDVRHSFRA
jgi:hypothetical protein